MFLTLYYNCLTKSTMLTKGKFMFSKLFSKQQGYSKATLLHASSALIELGKAMWSFAEATLCGITCLGDMLIKGVPDPEAGTKAAKHLADGIVNLTKALCHTVASIGNSVVVAADILAAAGEVAVAKAVPVINSATISAKNMFDSPFSDQSDNLSNDLKSVDSDAEIREGDIFYTPHEIHVVGDTPYAAEAA